MTQYEFIKPYSIVINIGGTQGLSDKAISGGAVNTATINFSKGDLVDGEKVDLYVNEIGGKKKYGAAVNIKNPSTNALQPIIQIPINFLSEVNSANTSSQPTANKTQSVSMYNPKNIVIGVLIIATTFGILKVYKVI